MHEFQIGVNDAGQRADKFLTKACPNLPKSLLYKTFRKKDVKLNGKRIPPETFLTAGSVLQVYLPDEFFPAQPQPVQTTFLPEPVIFYEDANIAILQKPADLPVHADDKGSADTLAARFLSYLTQSGAYDPAQEQSFRPALCNRLDRNTEGFVIGAKNAAALRTINEKIRSGDVQKQYLCITVGTPPKKQDTVTAYHRREEGKKAQISPLPHAGFREIRTGYEVLQTVDGLSLVLVTLYTGRTHQIRAQMAALGSPVLGDGKYGNPVANKKYRRSYQCLAACRLKINAPAPGDLFAYLHNRQFAYIPTLCKQYGFSVLE